MLLSITQKNVKITWLASSYTYIMIASYNNNILFICLICCSVAPYSVVIMGNTSYSQGEQLQLRCSSEGGPQLEYTWTFSGGMITNANSNILTIDNVTTSNGGNYTCNVTNNAGYNTSTVTVYSKLF